MSPPHAESTTLLHDVVAASSSNYADLPLLTSDQVARLCSAGRIVFFFDDRVYDASAFVASHPGGALVLQHAVARDVTDVVTAYHPADVLRDRLPRYCIGRLAQDDPKVAKTTTTTTKKKKGDERRLPDGRTVAEHQRISQSYRQLRRELERDGFFARYATDYVWDVLRCVVAFASSVYLCIAYGSSWPACLLAGLLLGVFWHQAAFIGHDLGHASVTHHLRRDHILGILLANALGGVSLGWWKSNHNVHHVVTNSPEHDPDIQHLPFFAISERFLQPDGVYSSFKRRHLPWDAVARLFIAWQHRLYYIVLSFGRFNLYAESWRFVLLEPHVRLRAFEIAAMTTFHVWHTLMLAQLPSWWHRLAFIYISHASTGFLHVQITLSHFAMPTDDYGPDESFAAHQIRTGMDVQCLAGLDWVHGGLQFQVTHHLFPRMPKHRLRDATERVKRWAERWNLTIVQVGFVEGNRMVLRRLEQVAKMALRR